MPEYNYTDADFRIYIQAEGNQLKQLLEKLSAPSQIIAEFPDRERVDASVSKAWYPAEDFLKTLRRLNRDLVFERIRINSGDVYPPLGKRVLRARRLHERKEKSAK